MKQFTIADPTTFEGTPFEVAERAIRQVRGIVALAHQTLEDADVMVRNAQLSRNLLADGDAAAAEWPQHPQRRKLDSITSDLARLSRELSVVAQAAGFDPQHPPKE